MPSKRVFPTIQLKWFEMGSDTDCTKTNKQKKNPNKSKECISLSPLSMQQAARGTEGQ